MDTFEMSDGSGIQLLAHCKNVDEVAFSEPALIIFARLKGKAREVAREVLGDEFFSRLEKAAGAEYLKERAAVDERRKEAKANAAVNSGWLEKSLSGAGQMISSEKMAAIEKEVAALTASVKNLTATIGEMTLPIEAAEKRVRKAELKKLKEALAEKAREMRFGGFRVLPPSILYHLSDERGYPRFALLPLDGAVFRAGLSCRPFNRQDCRWSWYVMGNKEGYESSGEYYPRSEPSNLYSAFVESYYLGLFGATRENKAEDAFAACNEEKSAFYMTTGVSASLPSSLRSLIKEAKPHFKELFFLVPANWADEKTTDRMVYFAEGKGVCVGWDGEQFVVLGDFPLTPTERYL